MWPPGEPGMESAQVVGSTPQGRDDQVPYFVVMGAVLIALILVITCGVGLHWLYNVYLKRWMRWKQPEAGSMDPGQRDSLGHQLYRPIRKNEHFDKNGFVEKLLYSVVIVPMALFGGFMMNDSMHEAIYLALMCAIAIVLSSIIDGLYDMGDVWSNGGLFGSLLFVFVVSVLIHPLLFGRPIFT